MRLIVNESNITWPGRLSTKPEGFMIPTHLKVLTIEEKPFVYVREITETESCLPEEIICPHFNATEDEGKLPHCQTRNFPQKPTLGECQALPKREILRRPPQSTIHGEN